MKQVNVLQHTISARSIQIALGLLWLLDGGLQLQHQMFTSNFATQVIALSGQGQPLVVYGPINFEIHLLLLHPAVFDSLFALTQLLIGALILWKRSTRIGLWAAIIWGLGVWYMGEGLGGLLSGHTSLLTGAPGAALLYVGLAVALLPIWYPKKTADRARPAYWLPVFWAMLWLIGAVYQLLPGQNSSRAIAATIASNVGNGAPGWLGSLDIHVAKLIAGSSLSFVLVLALVEAAIGIGIFLPGQLRKIAIGAGIMLSLSFWIVGQSLGSYFSGLATDPNSAPLFILLGIATLGTEQFNVALLKQGFVASCKYINAALNDVPALKG